MLVTLFTDASHCTKTRVAAYAAWAKTDGRTVRRAGVLKEPVPDSSVADCLIRPRPGQPSNCRGITVRMTEASPGAMLRLSDPPQTPVERERNHEDR
jgi:hypothetical protein